MFIVTCFEIWRNRNNEIFQHVKRDTLTSVNNIFSYHSSMVQALGPIRMQCVTRRVHWHPPSEGIIKVNVDGYSFGNLGNAYYGGLLRNNLRIRIQGFFGTCGRAYNLVAELIAIWKGISQLWI
jgi:hypothetical protein